MAKRKISKKEKADLEEQAKDVFSPAQMVGFRQLLDRAEEGKSINLQIRATPSMIAAMDKARGNVPRATFACEILRVFLLPGEKE